MPNGLRYDGRVAIITGAGNGLGKSHALLLASRGAKIVVNDLGGSFKGEGKSSAAADAVVAEIKAKGGDAVANYDSVEDGAKIVQCALDNFKRVDIVVNNAGILRDTTFHKMTEADWELIYRVHVLGSFRVTHAAWPHMRDAKYGRVIFTASAAGIYGNFGQANYAMAKLGVVGMAQTLALEGKKANVHVNAIAPIAGSRMTETVLPPDLIAALSPEFVSPLVAYLCHDSCEETGGLFEVGGGFMGKLRWERAEGALFKLNGAITPEAVEKKWTAIAGFDKTTHPTDITSSMQPILGNLGTAKEKGGGNEFIDVGEALGYEFPPMDLSYDERDLALYALGVGAAQNPLDPKELQYVYELNGEGFHALPTFGVVPAIKLAFDMAKQGKQAPGLHYGFDRVLHGEQYTEIKRPLPPHAKLTHKAKIKDIFDKGKNALVVTAMTSYDEDGNELIYNELTTFVRGAGGWGGDRGPTGEVNVPPDRAPDATITEKISESQALLYRLSGDWNPLHADPSFAKNFGFERPILHGLCTFGYSGRHVIKAFCNNDPRLFKSIKTRFSDSVFPGETLVTEMWKESDTKIIFRTKVKERDKVVISGAAVELYKEIPKAAAKKAATSHATTPTSANVASAPAASANFEPASADVFTAIEDHIARNPDLASKIATTFLFKLTSPNSEWTVDLKNGKGSVAQGAGDKPDCTLELTDADFMAMTSGKADAQKLYFGGKLKIAGNVMASQKLEFLKKMDPEQAKAAVLKKRGGAGASVGTGGEAALPSGEDGGAPGALKSEHVFFAIGHHLETHPELAPKIQTTFQWKLTNPESAWFLDAKNGSGSCKAGSGEKPDVTLELSDDDFMSMSTGKADPQKLYFGGKLKISGNVMASQKLEFLKKVDSAAAMKAYAAKHAGGASSGGGGAAKAATSAPASASKDAKSPAIFKALSDRLAKNPSLAKETAQVIAFRVKSGGDEKRYVVDLTHAGSVSEGDDAKAVSTLTIDDDDLASLVKGANVAEGAKDLYMRGKLRIDGDARIAQKLGFLNNLA
jgi:3-hydroxyacyl-CoA dehydrogenase/3a,7a,12a-trihydroxy-5b-cholest-24-enoyl-CoA hydratase